MATREPDPGDPDDAYTPTATNDESEKLEDNRKKQLESIGVERTAPPETKLKATLDATWKNMFNRLLDYHKMNGHYNVRACENLSLYGWVRTQRSLFYSNNLDKDRRRQLDSIGFEWSREEMDDAKWKNKFYQLSEYQKVNGHCNVRYSENMPLYNWVRVQLLAFNSNTLDEDRRRLLDSIGFEWTAPSRAARLDAAWKNNYDQMIDYHKLNGHCNVRAGENRSLYNWVRKQRCLFYSNKLNEDRKRQLDSIGFEWTAPPETTRKAMLDATWKNMFDQLSEYQKMNGHCNVRSTENRKLDKWVRRQRQLFESQKLEEKRRRQLESIEFDWTAPPKTTRNSWFDAIWKSSFDEMLDYQKMNGHCSVRACENKSLYYWVRKQRRLFYSNNLDKDRSRQLESIGFEWTAPPSREAIFDAAWKSSFDQVLEYQRMNGHCNIRRCENSSLYYWVRKQRRLFYSDTLDEDRQRELDLIGFEWTVPPETLQKGTFDSTWKSMFDKLSEYLEINGHCNVRHSESAPLHNWVRRQRQNFELEKLEDYRKKLLESIGFEWTAPQVTARKGRLDAAWKDKFDQLSEYREMNGHCNVRACENKSSYSWVGAQRRLFYSNTLDEDRKKKLDSMRFDWDEEGRLDATWKNQFDQLLEYQKTNGHCNVRYSENIPLYYWVKRQRCLFDSNTLDQDRKRQLVSIGFELNPANPEDRKEEHEDGDEEGLKLDVVTRSSADIDKIEIRKLRHFSQVHGHCNVTAEQDEALARWVSRQRRLFSRGKLSMEQMEQLESIDGFYFVPAATVPSNSNNELTTVACHETSDSDDYYHGNDGGKEDKVGVGYIGVNPGHADSKKRPTQEPILSQPIIVKKRRRSYSPTPDSQISSLPTLSTMGARPEPQETHSTRLTPQDVQGKMSESEKMFYVHKRVAKPFGGQLFGGTVVSFRDVNEKITYWKVEYDDGDAEEFDLEELKQFIDSCLSLNMNKQDIGQGRVRV